MSEELDRTINQLIAALVRRDAPAGSLAKLGECLNAFYKETGKYHPFTHKYPDLCEDLS